MHLKTKLAEECLQIWPENRIIVLPKPQIVFEGIIFFVLLQQQGNNNRVLLLLQQQNI